MRNTFVRCVLDQARSDDRVFLLTPDLGYSVLEPFQKEFPDRFLNTGIAEQNTIGVAAGLALSGKIVYVYSIIPFVTMRCFEQVRVDVAYMNTNVRLIGVGSGLSYGPAGATHHSIEDISIMRTLPNMTVCCPGDPVELEGLLTDSVEHQGPMYFRLGKNGEQRVVPDTVTIKVGKAVELTSGSDLSLIVTSNMLHQGMEWVKQWEKEGISVSLISMPTIKPLDVPLVLDLIDRGSPIITLEEHSVIGGLGSAIAEVIAESGKAVRFQRIGIKDEYSHYVGGQQFLRRKLGLSDRPLIVK